MDIRIHEAGKPEGSRALDTRLSKDQGSLTIGGEGADVVVPGLEGVLAEVEIAGGKATIKRAGGERVSVGGREVGEGAAQALGGETLLSIGGKDLVWKSGAAAGGSGGPGEADGERPSLMAKDMLKQVYAVLGVPEGDQPALIVYDAQDKLVKRLDIAPKDEEITIGRDGSNRLALYHGSVSKSHARVVRDGVGWLVYDLESKNGVEVNGARVSGKSRLKSGDRIHIGDFNLRFVDPKSQGDLSASVPDLKKLEKGRPGEKVEVGDKAAAARVEDTHTALKPSGAHAATPPAPAPSAPAAPKPPEPGGGGGNLLFYALIGFGVLGLLAAIGLIVAAMGG